MKRTLIFLFLCIPLMALAQTTLTPEQKLEQAQRQLEEAKAALEQAKADAAKAKAEAEAKAKKEAEDKAKASEVEKKIAEMNAEAERLSRRLPHCVRLLIRHRRVRRLLRRRRILPQTRWVIRRLTHGSFRQQLQQRPCVRRMWTQIARLTRIFICRKDSYQRSTDR